MKSKKTGNKKKNNGKNTKARKSGNSKSKSKSNKGIGAILNDSKLKLVDVSEDFAKSLNVHNDILNVFKYPEHDGTNDNQDNVLHNSEHDNISIHQDSEKTTPSQDTNQKV